MMIYNSNNSIVTRSLLSLSDIQEIWNVFDAFDDDRSGRLSIQTTTIACRALGFQVTEEQVATEMRSILANSSNDLQQQNDDNILVNFDMICQFLRDKFKMRNSENELAIIFRLFDESDKGYITVQDLQRVAKEVSCQDDDDANEINIRRMVDFFDKDQDGCINFDEFKIIMKKSC